MKSRWAWISMSSLIWSACRPVPLHVTSLLSDHVVLQAGKSLTLQGQATPGAKVTATYRGQSYEATASRSAEWKIPLPPLSSGDGSDLTLNTIREQLVIHDVAVGEVWVCSGQSNMEFHLGWGTHGAAEVAASSDSDLRMYTVAHAIEDSPSSKEPVGDWKPSGPATAYDFSAACYFFGKELRRAMGVPIGLIHSAWSGTLGESWMTTESLAADPILAPILLPGIHPDDAPFPERHPAVLYHGMVEPLSATAIRGVAWYQGESNAYRAFQYRSLLPALIGDWRKLWNDPSLPFEIVQLPNYRARLDEPAESDWAELREAQLLTSRNLPHVGFTVAIDLGDATDLHPRDKSELGRRLAWSALTDVYGYQGGGAAPVLQSWALEGDSIRLNFGSGGPAEVRLRSGEAVPKGFSIAGADRKFHWAQAKLQADGTVVIHSESVVQPQSARYGWADNPEVNLVSVDGIPLSPFRTDSWPGITDKFR